MKMASLAASGFAVVKLDMLVNGWVSRPLHVLEQAAAVSLMNHILPENVMVTVPTLLPTLLDSV